MEKVSVKQGSSTVDISILMMAASFRHHRAPAVVGNQKWTSTAFSQYISSAVESLNLHFQWMAQHRKQLASYFDAYKAGNSREGTSHHSTVQMTCKSLSNENKAENSSCWLQSAAAGITEQEAKWVKDGWPCEAKDESADDANSTNRKSKLCVFTDGVGVDRTANKRKEAPAPLPNHRRKLCQGNEDGSSETAYVVFSERALGTQWASSLSRFGSVVQ